VAEAWQPPASLTDFADLDHDRAARRGYPEAVYCEGKSPEQVAVIAAAVRERGTTTLFTRATAAHAKAILMVIPDAHHDEQAHLLAWPAQPPEPSGGLVLVVTAGTSDLPVAREALSTARYLGRRAELVVDVGVAGLHRVLRQNETSLPQRCVSSARLGRPHGPRLVPTITGCRGEVGDAWPGCISTGRRARG